MTTQQPTARQGANAWKMGIYEFKPIFTMGFLLPLCGINNTTTWRYFYEHKNTEDSKQNG